MGEKKKTKAEKMTWGEVLARMQVFNSLPLDRDGRSVTGAALASIILLQVDYTRTAGEFEERLQKAVERLRERLCPDYGEQTQKPEEERREGFAEDARKYMEAVNAMAAEEEQKECPVSLRGLTREEFGELCALGASGTAKHNGQDIPVAVLLRTAAQWVDA